MTDEEKRDALALLQLMTSRVDQDERIVALLPSYRGHDHHAYSTIRTVADCSLRERRIAQITLDLVDTKDKDAAKEFLKWCALLGRARTNTANAVIEAEERYGSDD